jgi:hypothetical protein
MKIVGKQTANFRRNEAIDLMNNWLVAGTKIDAVAANNDEMAIGAILALQQAGKDPKKLVSGGIDATPDALAEMEKGNLVVTVFQDGTGQEGCGGDCGSSSSRARRLSPLYDPVRACHPGRLQGLPQEVMLLVLETAAAQPLAEHNAFHAATLMESFGLQLTAIFTDRPVLSDSVALSASNWALNPSSSDGLGGAPLAA